MLVKIARTTAYARLTLNDRQHGVTSWYLNMAVGCALIISTHEMSISIIVDGRLPPGGVAACSVATGRYLLFDDCAQAST